MCIGFKIFLGQSLDGKDVDVGGSEGGGCDGGDGRGGGGRGGGGCGGGCGFGRDYKGVELGMKVDEWMEIGWILGWIWVWWRW